MSVGKDMAALSSLMKKATLKIPDRYVPLDLKSKMQRAADLVTGLCACIERHVFHGDIKPDNSFWDNKEAVVADFGTSKIISNMIQLMKPVFRLESEEEHDKIKLLLQALQSKREVQIKACLKSSEPQMKKLAEWNIYDATYSLLDASKEKMLDQYLKTSFLPTKSTGFACPLYSKAICDYFWRCDAVNLERACNAFDMRAMGVTLYVLFTAADIPTSTTDTLEYYQTLQEKLTKLGLPDKAVVFIRRLAEPMKPFNTTSGDQFPLPLEVKELKELAALLKSV